MSIQNMALLISQHFLDGHQDHVTARSFDKTTSSRKRLSDRSTTSTTDSIAVKGPLISVETSAYVQVNDDVTSHLDIFNTVSSSQSSGKSDSGENGQLYVANSTKADSYNALVESILRSYKLCFITLVYLLLNL